MSSFAVQEEVLLANEFNALLRHAGIRGRATEYGIATFLVFSFDQ